MKEDLEAEKRAFTKHRATREKQLSQFVKNMVAMYADIQGISGNVLQKIEALSLEEGTWNFCDRSISASHTLPSMA